MKGKTLLVGDAGAVRREASECNALLSRIPCTKDGKKILWGDVVYFPHPDRMSLDHFEDVVEAPIDSIMLGLEFDEYKGTHTLLVGDYEMGNLDVYSSRGLVPLDCFLTIEVRELK